MIRKYGMCFISQESLDRYEDRRNDIRQIYDGVSLDIQDRWEKGIEHHPRSIEMMHRLMDLDFYFCADHFGFKIGGDGDNGEMLLYLLDIIYEKQNIKEKS